MKLEYQYPFGSTPQQSEVLKPLYDGLIQREGVECIIDDIFNGILQIGGNVKVSYCKLLRKLRISIDYFLRYDPKKHKDRKWEWHEVGVARLSGSVGGEMNLIDSAIKTVAGKKFNIQYNGNSKGIASYSLTSREECYL